VQWVIYWRLILALLKFQSKVQYYDKDGVSFSMEEVVDLTTNLQVNIMADPLVDLWMDILANPLMDL